nr:unknown [Vitreoscilla sp. C1]
MSLRIKPRKNQNCATINTTITIMSPKAVNIAQYSTHTKANNACKTAISVKNPTQTQLSFIHCFGVISKIGPNIFWMPGVPPKNNGLIAKPNANTALIIGAFKRM